MFGPHTVDRFASVSTALLPAYNSRFADSFLAGVDAQGQTDWGGQNNWVNPPFRLIPLAECGRLTGRILFFDAFLPLVLPCMRRLVLITRRRIHR